MNVQEVMEKYDVLCQENGYKRAYFKDVLEHRNLEDIEIILKDSNKHANLPCNSSSHTPCHLAVQYNDLPMLKLLHRYNGDLNVQHKLDSHTPFHTAIYCNCLDIAIWLTEQLNILIAENDSEKDYPEHKNSMSYKELLEYSRKRDTESKEFYEKYMEFYNMFRSEKQK